MKALFLSLITCCMTAIVWSQDRIFTYTYQSNVLNQTQKELEVWTTVLEGKEDYYRAIQTRVEYEIGLGNQLQVAFYLNTKQTSYLDTANGVIALEPAEISFSNEWKYKFSDAQADEIGFAGYTELTVAADELEWELKAIFDKRIGQTLHALNLIYEPEWKKTVTNGKVATENELKYAMHYGFSYQVTKNWNLGSELLCRSVYFKESKQTHSALFAGPTLAYNKGNFWLNLTAMPQWTNLNHSTVDRPQNLTEFTKWESRLIFSYAF